MALEVKTLLSIHSFLTQMTLPMIDFFIKFKVGPAFDVHYPGTRLIRDFETRNTSKK